MSTENESAPSIERSPFVDFEERMEFLDLFEPDEPESDTRAEFLRRFDDLISYAKANPFPGRRKALRALLQVRRQRSLLRFGVNHFEGDR